ncbi:MAG: hypothetical protein HW421_3980 [Ignavibacteria bacterium]|nr:hypothetical protein [Ignavibacteria bacterium]
MVKKSTIIIMVIGIISVITGFSIGTVENTPGITLVLLGFFAISYSVLSNFGKTKNLRPIIKFIYWSPRVLCIITILFLSLFALDVFQEHHGFFHIILALLIHLIPSLLILVILIISWQREWIGGFLFNILGILYIVSAWGNFPISVYFLISGPLFLTGILFLINWRLKGKYFQNPD